MNPNARHEGIRVRDRELARAAERARQLREARMHQARSGRPGTASEIGVDVITAADHG